MMTASYEDEIERRWIIRSVPKLVNTIANSITREVGYIFVKDGEMRVVKKYKSDDTKHLLTIKTDGDLVRKEWQEKIPEWAANILWNKVNSDILKITRHYINYFDKVLEVDEYHGKLKGLIKLEVEFSNKEDASNFVLPDFVGDACEVTSDSNFNNKNIASMKKSRLKKLLNDIKDIWSKYG